jgi:hypothetical protein
MGSSLGSNDGSSCAAAGAGAGITGSVEQQAASIYACAKAPQASLSTWTSAIMIVQVMVLRCCGLCSMLLLAWRRCQQ